MRQHHQAPNVVAQVHGLVVEDEGYRQASVLGACRGVGGGGGVQPFLGWGVVRGGWLIMSSFAADLS